MGTKSTTILFVNFLVCLVGVGGRRRGDCVEDYDMVTLPPLSSAIFRQDVEFRMNDRTLRLTLTKVDTGFDENAVVNIVDHDGTVTTTYSRYARDRGFPSALFAGRVVGDPQSFVYGTIDDEGIFEGSFEMDGTEYHLEPIRGDFDEDGPNAVLYRSTDSGAPCPRPRLGYGPGSARCDAKPRRRSVPSDMAKMSKSSLNLTDLTRSCEMKLVADFRYSQFVERSDPTLIRDAIVRAVSYLTSYDFDEDGEPDRIGFHVVQFDIYKKPIRPNLTDFSWDPIAFFQEMNLYNFGTHCGGLYLTYRKMELSSEMYGPTLFRSNPISHEQGICSRRKPSVPGSSLNDYGPHVTNVLPINFRYGEGKVSEVRAPMITRQILHQFLHLLGALDDNEYKDKRCRGDWFYRKWYHYVMTFPVPPAEHGYGISLCTRRSVATYLRMNDRMCLTACFQCSPWELDVFNEIATEGTYPSTTTTERTIDDWTEVCFITLIDSTSRLHGTSGILVLVILLILMALLFFLS